ncbi:MAG: hypothetical protein H7326_06520, partial [Bdellovibrionaceae bacterium]|nr:hypothetical protein [Pseudobdellovibrionaceae bacterium]
MKVEQLSIQHDHIHLLVRTGRRSQYQHFFRVVAGQIAQRFEKEGLFAAGPAVTGTPNTPSNALATSNKDNGTHAKSNAKPRLWQHRP